MNGITRTIEHNWDDDDEKYIPETIDTIAMCFPNGRHYKYVTMRPSGSPGPGPSPPTQQQNAPFKSQWFRSNPSLIKSFTQSSSSTEWHFNNTGTHPFEAIWEEKTLQERLFLCYSCNV